MTHKNLIVIHNSLLICYSFFEYSLDCGDKTVCQHDWDENCKFDQNQNFNKFTSIYERNIEGIYSQTKNFVNNTILNTIDHSKNKTFWNVCENFIHKSFWSLDFNECKLDFNTKKYEICYLSDQILSILNFSTKVLRLIILFNRFVLYDKFSSWLFI